MQRLIKLAATKEGLVNIRSELTNVDMFTNFINCCLMHLNMSIQWRYHVYTTHISDMFTVSDRALCVLVILDYSEDLIRVYNKGEKLSMK